MSTEFKVGDRVECVNVNNMPSGLKLILGDTYTVKEIQCDQFVLEGIDDDYTPNQNRFKLVTNNKTKTTKEETMNKNIVAAFPKTEDAVLVEEQLGNQIVDNFIQGLVIKQYAKEILAEAEKLKKEKEDK